MYLLSWNLQRPEGNPFPRWRSILSPMCCSENRGSLWATFPVDSRPQLSQLSSLSLTAHTPKVSSFPSRPSCLGFPSCPSLSWR